jgi:predicted transcriptional regulator
VGKEIKHFYLFFLEMSLEKIHREILRLLYDNVPQDFSDTGGVSRKILFKSVNFKPRQVKKACSDLESKGYVHLHTGFYNNEWNSISISDKGIDFLESSRSP